MKKPVFYTEFSHFIGIAIAATGTAMTAWGDFGISMVVGPAFVLHLKMSQIFPWFTFGVAQYILQASVLILMMCLLRRVKLTYFLSFLTAVLSGLILDGVTGLLSLLPEKHLWQRILVYVCGDVAVCAGIAMVFHTYFPPEAYEMFVMELSKKLKIKLHTLKTIYDCTSMAVAIAMSLLLLGGLQGVGIGSVVCALLNGSLINLFSRLYDKIWVFEDRFPLRKKLTESEEIL